MHNWVGKMILWKLSKKLEFYHTIKYDILKSESVIQSEILWDFVIQTNYSISARRLDLVIILKNHRQVDFIAPTDYRVKIKESEKRYKYLDLLEN